MNKTMTVSLGGKDLILNFGVNRFYHLFKEGTGQDILIFGEGFDADKLVLFAQGFIYSGYYSDCKLKKVQPEFSKDEIFELVMDADSSLAYDIFSRYNESQTPGEAQSQPNP